MISTQNRIFVSSSEETVHQKRGVYSHRITCSHFLHLPADPDCFAVLLRWFERLCRYLLPPLFLHLVHSLEGTCPTAWFCAPSSHPAGVVHTSASGTHIIVSGVYTRRSGATHGDMRAASRCVHNTSRLRIGGAACTPVAPRPHPAERRTPHWRQPRVRDMMNSVTRSKI